ncbi:hypothetical protein QQF64_034702 [Cirrhinus molitorella]|uniref:Secreted protein n=1 Tax=Cirrhinus molitorella TaxID=172907 RepID=A0ABR3L5I3_9TELE
MALLGSGVGCVSWFFRRQKHKLIDKLIGLCVLHMRDHIIPSCYPKHLPDCPLCVYPSGMETLCNDEPALKVPLIAGPPKTTPAIHLSTS